VAWTVCRMNGIDALTSLKPSLAPQGSLVPTLVLVALAVMLFSSAVALSQETQADSPRSTGQHRSNSADFERSLDQATKGDPESQRKVGVMYLTGTAPVKDEAQGFNWIYRSALQGDAKARRDIAIAYLKGDGTKQNYEASFQWYREAALRGQPASQNRLCDWYEKGIGVETDPVIAYAWCLIRKRAGERTFVQTQLATLDNTLSAAQKRESISLAEGKVQGESLLVPLHSRWFADQHRFGNTQYTRKDLGIIPSDGSSSCDSGHWIESVSDDGGIVKLEDSSLWQVDPPKI
jgi:Sel1 repeat